MSPIPSLTWTTPADVAAQLARYLRSSGPPVHPLAVPDPSPRVRAAELLTLCATPAQRSCLRALALNPREEVEVRQQALLGLARIGAGVSAPEFERLIADPRLREEGSVLFETADLLTVVRSQQAVAAARRYLQSLSATERAELTASRRDAMSPALSEWLYHRWLKTDRLALTAQRGTHSPNVEVIRMTRERVESRAVLQELWRDARGVERDELLDALHDDETVWTFPGELTAAETTELTEALCLPLDALLANSGRVHLLGEINALLVADERVGLPRGQYRPRVGPEDQRRFLRALRILRYWQDPLLDEWIADHVLSARIDADVRWWLLDVLWRRNRGLAVTVIIAALRTGDWKCVRIHLDSAAREPEESDRAMFWEAARAEYGSEVQFQGLCGLDLLGESSEEWLEKLAAWAHHPEPRLRIRALAALARRGDLSSLEALQLWAEDPNPLHERAEVVGALAKLEPAAHVALFERALEREETWEPHPDYGEPPQYAPIAEEAVSALARLQTPEALTPLLRSYLTAESRGLAGAEWEAFSAILEAEPGTPPFFRPYELNWRTAIRWPWTDAGSV